MDEQKKIDTIAEILEVEPEEVILEKKLEDYDTWDSVAILSVIVVMNDEFNKYPSAQDVLKNKTVKDLMNFFQ